jgi:hypothetical protein
LRFRADEPSAQTGPRGEEHAITNLVVGCDVRSIFRNGLLASNFDTAFRARSILKHAALLHFKTNDIREFKKAISVISCHNKAVHNSPLPQTHPPELI